MRKANRIFLLGLVFAVLALNVAQACSKAEEDAFFEKKDKSFWVLRNKEAFDKATQVLIDEDGNWKGASPIPEYIKFSYPLTRDDLPCLERWLSLKDLECFAIADKNEHPNLELIVSWVSDLKDQGGI